MPTVVREDGFVVRVYGPPREHPPVYGMKGQDVVKAVRIVEKHHATIPATWRRIHG